MIAIENYNSATWQERIDNRFRIRHSFVQLTGPGYRDEKRLDILIEAG